MKIAHVSSLFHPLPPVEYGGTQRIIAQISTFQALVQGHDVYVYCSADSGIIGFAENLARKADLSYTISDSALFVQTAQGECGALHFRTTGTNSLKNSVHEQSIEHEKLAALVKHDDGEINFDIIHCHKPILLNSFCDPDYRSRVVLHAHDHTIPHHPAYSFPVIAISHTQKEKLVIHGHNVVGVAYNSIDSQRYSGTADDAGYLCFLGTFKPEKGAKIAISIAKAAGLPLILAGAPDSRPTSQAYFANHIFPHINSGGKNLIRNTTTYDQHALRNSIAQIKDDTKQQAPIIYVGNINDAQKAFVLGGSLACLFPVTWQEPFGLVMIESFANGTPVIANTHFEGKSCGATSEVVRDGETGFHVSALSEEDCVIKSVAALQNIQQLDRRNIRNIFERTWCSEIRINDLNGLYQKILDINVGIPIESLHFTFP